MNALRGIPPSFLLPAWTHSQLLLLGANVTRIARSRRFSCQRSLKSAERQDPQDGNPSGHRNTERLQGTTQVLGYVSPGRARYEEGIRQIEERLSRKQDRKARTATYHFQQREKKMEQHMISEYQKRKKQIQDLSRHDGPSIRRFRPRQAHLDPNGNDDADDLIIVPTKTDQNQPRSISGHKNPTDSSLGASSTGAKSPPERSLLEELFPEEASKFLTAQKSSKKLQALTEAPELPLPTVEDLYDDSILVSKLSPRPRLVSTMPQKPLPPIPSVLVLENALPNLIEADFKRITPRGTHIEEWKGGYDPIAIVPARVDALTQCTGKYYLVFQASTHAKAWQSRIQLIHEIVSQNSSDSIDSQVIPPRGFKAGGEDIGRLLRDYSIFSTSITPRMTLYNNPQSDATFEYELNMLAARMQPRNDGIQPGRSVLVRINGWTLGTISIVKRMVAVDGRLRHGAWGNSSDNTMIKDYFDGSERSHDEIESDHNAQSRPRQRYWTVRLRDEAEARRFVRAWHNRPFPAWEQYKKDDTDEPWPLVKAELLW